MWLLSVVLVWGLNKLAAKVLLESLSPLAVFTAQMMGVALLLCLVVVCRRQRLCDWGAMLGAVALSGLLFLGQRLLFFAGQKLTTVSQGTLFMDTSPLWTALIVAALGIEVIRWRNWLGVALGLGGVALVLFGGSQAASQYAPAPLLGNLILASSAILLAVHMVVTRGWMQRFGALRVMAMTHVAALIYVLPWGAPALARTEWASLSALQYWLLAYTIVLAGAYGFVAWYGVIRRTSAARVAAYQFAMPVVSALGAILLLGEHLAPWQILGFVVALLGVYLARPAPRAKPAAPDAGA